MSRQLSLLDAIWIEVKDGNDTARAIFHSHYSRRHYQDGRCFLRAGWRHCGWTKGGLRILEIRP